MAAIADGRRGAVQVFVLAGLGLMTSAAAQMPDEFNLSAPQPGIYVHLGKNLPLDAPGHDDIANIGFIVGSRCVAVIDTGGRCGSGASCGLKSGAARRCRCAT